ncbi:MAG: hypothetical protein A2934_00795 [Candidatus Sungbacteria bacterium RIFCSPLOWO2_01_FULL_47_10]|uniref:Uncharacterized protein n=1 Tax=Candidatus Sungbacteria bacterium RIFCSPLOWO2_01_FULL_47_10 TaxID=1802276 RepID=A0A1G2KYU3_9BACT|nr:MAG: hypothetical protein A2934_00795 [Candidatus Sungbacteria bacterium RIFCSPLOWO2_01_FULL_47_10]
MDPEKRHKLHIASEAPETERTPKRVFIEIGTRDFPVSWAGDKKFGENDIYIGLDLGVSRPWEARDNTESVDKLQDNMHFLRADASRLPVGGETTDEIFFGNVFGDPSIPFEKKRGIF